jgi:lysophospholipase L1-like esterase
VANFGALGYGTVEHIIQASLYRDRHGYRPDYAVYYIGWNDIRNAHLPNLDSGFADYHFPSQFDNLKVRRTGSQSFSPVLRILERMLAVRLDTIPLPPEYRKLPPMPGTDARLETLFRRNIETLVVINRAFGVAPVFMGQVLNREKLMQEKTDEMFGWVPRVLDRDLLPLQERFNTILKEECTRLGVPYIGVPMERFQQDDFVDVGHFSTPGARKFAELISAELKAACPPVPKVPGSGSH